MKTTHRCFLLLVIALTPMKTAASQTEVREVHYQMGTYFGMTLWHAEPETAKRLIRDAVQEVHRLDEILSTYDPNSPLSRLNRHAGAGSMRVPRELFDLLITARDLSEFTDGVFDVTVGPLMDLWRSAAEKNRLPTANRLAEVLAAVGYRKLELHGPADVELIHRGMKIDLGGIGKGYAVDRVAEILRAAGVSAALINFGGSSMRAVGSPPGKKGWQIAVQGADGRLRGWLDLRDAALSTSGAMGHGWIINGKKYGHLIHPISGAPITEARMATVIAPSATLAEVLTKPLVLIGPRALPMVEKFPDTDAVVIPESGAPSLTPRFHNRSSWKASSRP